MGQGKTCARCGIWKELTEFAIDKVRRDGHHPCCKACKRAEYRISYAKDPETRRERSKAWAKAHPEYTQAYEAARRGTRLTAYRTWCAAHRKELNAKRQAYNAAHREENKARHRAYKRANPGKLRAQWHNGRARRMGVGGTHTAAEWRALRDWFGNVCLRCGTADRICVDHVVPLSKGGTNTISNLQPLCGSCNRRKYKRSTDYRDPTRLAAFLETMKGTDHANSGHDEAELP